LIWIYIEKKFSIWQIVLFSLTKNLKFFVFVQYLSFWLSCIRICIANTDGSTWIWIPHASGSETLLTNNELTVLWIRIWILFWIIKNLNFFGLIRICNLKNKELCFKAGFRFLFLYKFSLDLELNTSSYKYRHKNQDFFQIKTKVVKINTAYLYLAIFQIPVAPWPTTATVSTLRRCTGSGPTPSWSPSCWAWQGSGWSRGEGGGLAHQRCSRPLRNDIRCFFKIFILSKSLVLCMKLWKVCLLLSTFFKHFCEV